MNDQPSSRGGIIGFLILFAVLVIGVAIALDVGGVGAWFGKLFSGAAGKAPQASTALPLAPSAPPHLALPAAVTPAWFIDAPGYNGAAGEQKSSGAPMELFFYKRACEPCRRVEHELLGSQEMKKALAESVKVRIDVEASRREWELTVRYGVSDLPALISVSAAGVARPIPVQRGGILLAPTLVAASLKP